MAAALGLSACSLATQPLAVALAGAGTSTAIAQSMNGTAYRTFTHTLDEVKVATLDTLDRMGIHVDRLANTEKSELIEGSARERSIEIELEPISDKATRMRVIARNGGLFYDAATATEIVLQAEKSLGVDEFTNASVGSNRRTRR
ncbi:MAG: DUF3568 family protein [Clostridia bacterium]